jgi:type 1 glutamine amidotransferase
MTKKQQVSRRRFLTVGAAAAGAVALPSVFSHCVWAGPDLQPVPDNELQKIADAVPAEATAKPKSKRRLLVFYRCEGFVHGAINRGNAALEMIGEKTGAWQATASQDMSVFDPASLKEFDAVMFNNSTALKFENETHRKALMDFVKSGKGVCGIHAATDNFYNWPEAAAMMGGLFDGHPWGGGGTWAVQIEEPTHVLNRAFENKGFWVNDEIYKFKAPYTRDNLRILLGLDMTKKENVPGRPDGDNAIAWIRNFGEGRVFYSSLGHNNHIFWTPALLRHFLDGIQFAMGDLAADATPSAALASRPTIIPAPEKA